LGVEGPFFGVDEGGAGGSCWGGVEFWMTPIPHDPFTEGPLGDISGASGVAEGKGGLLARKLVGDRVVTVDRVVPLLADHREEGAGDVDDEIIDSSPDNSRPRGERDLRFEYGISMARDNPCV